MDEEKKALTFTCGACGSNFLDPDDLVAHVDNAPHDWFHQTWSGRIECIIERCPTCEPMIEARANDLETSCA